MLRRLAWSSVPSSSFSAARVNEIVAPSRRNNDCSMASATAQVSVSIGINLPVYPELVPVRGYPAYYAPQANSNYAAMCASEQTAFAGADILVTYRLARCMSALAHQSWKPRSTGGQQQRSKS